jgi:oligopeptide transport system substrate-binding protein
VAPGPTLGARVLLAALLLLGSAACTDDDDPNPPSTTDTTVQGGTMRLGIGGDLVVDPVDASLASPRDLMVIDLLFDGLTRLDDQGVPQPAIASRWVGNPARTAFRFRVDPAATFASGRPVTAQDVIASLERVIAAGDTSLVALSLEAVSGFRAFVEGEDDHVSGLTAPDAQTVRIDLETPLSVLPEVLSSPLLSVVDPETIDGDLADLDLSGAWAVTSAEDDGLLVERRAGFTGSLGEVELRTYDDEESAYDGFADGEVDWAPVPSSRYEEAIEAYGDDAFAPFQAELYFGMNLGTPSLAAGPLRQAIMRAIDGDAIAEAIYADLADPLPTIVPAGVVGHDPDRCPECAYDPETAADIVGVLYPDGKVPTINIDFDRSTAQQEMAEMVAADLDAVGIPTKLHPLPLEEYKDFVVSGDQQLFSFGWIGAYGSPDAYLAPLFGSAANDNLTDYRSALVDGLLNRARAGIDPAENARRWAVAESTVLAAAVVVPIAQFRTQVVVAERVEGLETAVDGTVDWAQVRLAG